MSCIHSEIKIGNNNTHAKCHVCGTTFHVDAVSTLILNRLQFLEDKISRQQDMLEDCALDINRLEKKVA